jgi:hypothetical protein
VFLLQLAENIKVHAILCMEMSLNLRIFEILKKKCQIRSGIGDIACYFAAMMEGGLQKVVL